ncbi:MAG: GDP-mannose 4,6-dehydratase [Candidatus Nanoarchaeia archaeon]|jgi:dTDP-glucose 4,6-dehydratase|nr:GDP-mannose 4,6-dehydratase [Candidatus Nanoarchaeia archaeon]
MDILVVDGSGFIGTNFVQHLLDKYINYNVICIDKPEADKRNFEEIKNNRFYSYVVDTRDFSKFFKFWFRVDIIVYFADDAIRTTVLLDVLKKYKVKKYLQIAEQQELDKLALEATIVPAMVLKLSNNYGYFQHPSELVPNLITNALEGENLCVTERIRDWTSVLDSCRCLETLIHYGKIGESYEFGGGNEIKDIDIALFIMEYLQIPKQKLEFKQELIEPCFMDFSKLNKLYGWSPIIDMSAGLTDTIEWYKENESWWKALKIHG